jgi:hypothetical protein
LRNWRRRTKDKELWRRSLRKPRPTSASWAADEWMNLLNIRKWGKNPDKVYSRESRLSQRCGYGFMLSGVVYDKSQQKRICSIPLYVICYWFMYLTILATQQCSPIANCDVIGGVMRDKDRGCGSCWTVCRPPV